MAHRNHSAVVRIYTEYDHPHKKIQILYSYRNFNETYCTVKFNGKIQKIFFLIYLRLLYLFSRLNMQIKNIQKSFL